MKIILETIFLTMLGGTFGAFNKELHSKYQTMQNSEFVEYFNSQNNSWKMGQYDFKLSYTPMDFQKAYELHKNYYIPALRTVERIEHLPDNFDARGKWPHCHTIGEIYNQYWCNSCWAHGVANTASDRTCIHTQKHVELSEQDLECAHPRGTICNAGSPSRGFQFWKDHGLVTRECKPYKPEQMEKGRHGCVLQCDDIFNNYTQYKYYAENVYAIKIDWTVIKSELFLRGPIQASIKVYEDLYSPNGTGYKGGIYEYTYGLFQFFHSVRIIGYGVENGIEYLLAANTWGRTWGENGYVRIKFNQTDLFIDMYSGMPR